MRLMTDVPDAVRGLLGDGPFVSLADAGLSAGEATTWRAFAGDTAGWAGRAAAVLPGHAGPLIVLESAPASQFDRMHELLTAGADLPAGLACVALSGARFRGQRGRPWAALRGNLHLSVHLALDVDAASSQTALAVLPSVATAEAIEEVSGGRVRPGVKWVNDLLLAGRKVAGVLSATQLLGGRVRHVVIGIGVNVAVAPELPPSPRAAVPGCLADVDAVFAGPDAWARLLPAVLRGLARGRAALAEGRGDDLFAAYRSRAAFLRERVTIWPVEEDDAAAVRPIARGRVLELLPDLALVLDGVPEPVRVGRMTIDADEEAAGPDPSGP